MSKNKTSALSAFLKDRRGNFAPTMAVAFMALSMSAGVAIDYSNLSRSKAAIDNSLDAAILATGNAFLEKPLNDAQLRQTFEDYLYSNLSGDQELMNRVTINNFSIDRASGKINAELATPVQTAFLGLIGRSEVPVSSVTEARFSVSRTEVAMMLDVTGSMGPNGKLDALKLAAQDAIDILIPAGSGNGTVRVGLVPYSAGVNGGNYARIATGTNRTCATERLGAPHTDDYFQGNPLRADPRADCPTAQITPLSANANQLKQKVSNFRAAGYTAGHLGIGWSYYMLSEKWQDLWPVNSKPDDYASDTKKIAILMTDGEFNTFYRGVSTHEQGGQAPLSNAEAIALCNDMKQPKAGGNGITIYAVAFDAPVSAKATLEACATESDGSTRYFFDANSAAELRSAFREIASSIKTLRLSR